MTSLWLQNVASVHCHGDVIGFILRIMISEKEAGFGLKAEQEKELEEALPHGEVDQPMLSWPEDFDFVIDYHTMVNSSTLLMYTRCLKGLKSVKYALLSIIAREAGRDGA